MAKPTRPKTGRDDEPTDRPEADRNGPPATDRSEADRTGPAGDADKPADGVGPAEAGREPFAPPWEPSSEPAAAAPDGPRSRSDADPPDEDPAEPLERGEDATVPETLEESPGGAPVAETETSGPATSEPTASTATPPDGGISDPTASEPAPDPLASDAPAESAASGPATSGPATSEPASSEPGGSETDKREPGMSGPSLSDHATSATGPAGDPRSAAPDPWTSEPSTEPVGPSAPEPAAPSPAERIVEREVTVQKVGFVPLVLGGIIAAALGYAAAYLPNQAADDGPTVEDVAARVDAVEAEVAALPPPADLAELEGAVGAARDEIAQSTDSLNARIDTLASEVGSATAGLDERLTPLERAPQEDGTLAETAIASWERELGTLRTEIAEQQARMEEIAQGAEQRLEAARTETETLRAEAEAAAQNAAARAALAEVIAALQSGAPFEDALADLSAALGEVPEPLSAAAADGVPTLAALQEGYPEAARAALAAAREEGAEAEGNRLAGFLRETFEVRSVEPRAGSDPDAILSRAQAALEAGDLSTALEEEIAALPEAAGAAMSGWTQAARTRAAALDAADALSQDLSES